jgi:SET domain-containing protein
MTNDGTGSRMEIPEPRPIVTAGDRSTSQETLDAREGINEWFELGRSGIHGRGGFARCIIPAGTSVIEYVGDRVDKTESSRRCEDGNPFIFTINTDWDIDGNVDWNPARFLNHSCSPNCEAQQEDDRIWIVALRDIETGEELTFNYGYDLSEWRDYPCGCGAAACLGFIVAAEHHPAVRRQLELESANPIPANTTEAAVAPPANSGGSSPV